MQMQDGKEQKNKRKVTNAANRRKGRTGKAKSDEHAQWTVQRRRRRWGKKQTNNKKECKRCASAAAQHRRLQGRAGASDWE